jgi:hypothetical protein
MVKANESSQQLLQATTRAVGIDVNRIEKLI